MIQKHKQTIQSIKQHVRSRYKEFYPLILGYLFALFVLVSIGLLFSMSAIGGLAEYEDFLLNDLKPSYEATGEVSYQQAMQFEEFGQQMYGVLLFLALIIFAFVILFTCIKSLKDIYLWRQLHPKKYSLKKNFWKFSLQTFISALVFAIISIALLVFFPIPLLSLFLIALAWLLFETITYTLQAKNKTKFFTKKTLNVFLATVFTGIIFLILWWIGVLLIALAFSWSQLLILFLIVVLFIVLYSKRSLYLVYIVDAIFNPPKGKRKTIKKRSPKK